MGITFLRLVVHPAMWATILVTFRFMLRNIGQSPGRLPWSREGRGQCPPAVEPRVRGGCLAVARWIGPAVSAARASDVCVSS